MSKPINCPACGARMMFGGDSEPGYRPLVFVVCRACGLRGLDAIADTERGAAIAAGRAMRRIVAMVDERRARACREVARHATVAGGGQMARIVHEWITDDCLTADEIAERLRRDYGII